MRLYILRGREPVAVESLQAWAEWYETADRRVARTEVGGRDVSTVFLGLDHQYGKGPPLVFETMIFDKNGGDAGGCWRYSTYDEALAGHAAACALAAARDVPTDPGNPPRSL